MSNTTENNKSIASIEDSDYLSYKINRRSDVAMEVINSKPNFFERWGILLFTIIFILLFVSSYFFKYPDAVEGIAVLSSKNAPKAIVANESGRLLEFVSQDNKYVKKGETLVFIESPEKGNHIEILLLQKSLTNIIKSNFPISELNTFQKHQALNTGELQNSFKKLLVSISLLQEYKNGYYSMRKEKLRGDIHSLGKISENTADRKRILTDNNQIAKETFEMNEKLFREKVISLDEYRQQKSKLLSNELNIPDANTDIITNNIARNEKLSEIQSIMFSEKQQMDAIQQQIIDLKAQADLWVNTYCIIAPIDGTLSYDKQIQQDGLLKGSQGIGFIIPQNNILYAQVNLPQSNFGKIDTGMEVQLRFDAYPYHEYGAVVGRLIQVSKIANEIGFGGVIELRQGLKTNQGIELSYSEGLKASAIVITKDMSLMKRFWYGIIKKFDKTVKN